MGDAAPASAPPPFRDLEMEAIRHDLADARRNAAESRRQLNALRQTVRTATARPRSVEVVHASPAWGALRAPRVTIITALHGDFERGVPTLDSVAHSRLRDLELIAVNGGTAGSSPALLTEWMAAHPRIAAMLVASVTKRGTGAARNVALDFARAPYCLLLDPGQELYPRCLDVLTGTLDAMPDASFVYPIQEVVGQPDAFVAAGGDYLMSFLGWDPGRLRQGNWIHPPALIRTNCLREMGAFATDPRLDGMEDYDLWCRIAERDRRGQLVPQELARRVESESSPSLLALRPSPGPATRALVERSPALLAGAFPEP